MLVFNMFHSLRITLNQKESALVSRDIYGHLVSLIYFIANDSFIYATFFSLHA